MRTPARRIRAAAAARAESYPFRTLPDYLRRGLDLVFIGINPGLYSVARGHYFARPTTRFWPAFSRSTLSAGIRASLGRDRLGPEDDRTLLRFGIGFTDVVKVPSRSARDLSPRNYREWAPRLLDRLQTFRPNLACFHGLTGYRAFARFALREPARGWRLGLQPVRVGRTRLLVVPNPSPANAHFQARDYIAWYDRVARLLARRA
jgi:double-stranded uracil-DNA glycosylase